MCAVTAFADAAAMAKLHALCMERAWSAESFANMVAQNNVQGLAIKGAEQHGFILWRVMGKEAEILTLAVRPDKRRQGWGRALVQAVCHAARQAGAEAVHLEVPHNNEAATALYAGCGFVPVGRRDGYYGQADAILMCKKLVTNRQTG